MRLTKNDYKKILEHYGENVVYDSNNKTKKRKYNHAKTRELTRRVVAKKLCDCIKKVQRNTRLKLEEKAAIAICRNAIFSNRGLKHYRFTCKKKPTLLKKKGTRSMYLSKTRKIKFKNRK